MISLIEDLAANHKLFNETKFVQAFQTAQENELNFEFVRAVK